MAQRRFPRPWRFEPIPGGYRVIDANGPGAGPYAWATAGRSIAFSDQRLTDDEAETIARLIVRLPELVELERDRNKAKSRRRAPPPQRPVILGDLARDGKLLEVGCSACRPSPKPWFLAALLFPLIMLGSFPAGAQNLSDPCQTALTAFKKGGGYGAFAAAKNGACGSINDANDELTARNMAINDCRPNGGPSCRVIATINVPSELSREWASCVGLTASEIIAACDKLLGRKLDSEVMATAIASRAVRLCAQR